jgi:hypothetical protein
LWLERRRLGIERVEAEFEDVLLIHDPLYCELVGWVVEDDGDEHRLHADTHGAFDVLAIAIEAWLSNFIFNDFGDEKGVWDFIADGPQHTQLDKQLFAAYLKKRLKVQDLDCATGITACFYRGQNFN